MGELSTTYEFDVSLYGKVTIGFYNFYLIVVPSLMQYGRELEIHCGNILLLLNLLKTYS